MRTIPFLFFAFCFLNACKDRNQITILGEWRVDSIVVTHFNDIEPREKYISGGPIRKMIFNSDSTTELVMAKETIKGKRFSVEKRIGGSFIVLRKGEKGMRIVSLSWTSMHLEDYPEYDGQLHIANYYLRKQ